MTTEGYTINKSSITIFYNDRVANLDRSHANASEVIELLRSGRISEAYTKADLSLAIQSYVDSEVTIKDGQLWYKDSVIDNSLARRIIKMWKEGHDFSAMLNFLKNLQLNSSSRAVNELYRFLDANDLPITADGHFLAYKNVNNNYKDKHSGTFNNEIGQVCEMERNSVDDNPNNTCSTGLHFCSLEYLKSFWGTSGHTMIIKINPMDVVSIPVDYDNSKGRCCRYVVVDEHEQAKEGIEAFDSSVWNQYLEAYDEGYDDGFENGLSFQAGEERDI